MILVVMRLYAEFKNGIDLKVYFSIHFWHAFCFAGKWNCFSLELEPTAYSHLQMAIEQRIIWNPMFPFSTPDYAWFFIYSVWYLTTLCCTISSSSGQVLNWMCSSSVHRCRVLVRWDAASKTKLLQCKLSASSAHRQSMGKYSQWVKCCFIPVSTQPGRDPAGAAVWLFLTCACSNTHL